MYICVYIYIYIYMLRTIVIHDTCIVEVYIYIHVCIYIEGEMGLIKVLGPLGSSWAL